MKSLAAPTPGTTRPDRQAPGILWPLTAVVLLSLGAVAWLMYFLPVATPPPARPEAGVVVRR